LTSDNGTAYLTPSGEQKTLFTTPTESVDYLYIDRSAHLTPSVVDKIAAYLDYYKKTKLILYMKTSTAGEAAGLVKHAGLIFLEEDMPFYVAKEILEGYPREKIIKIAEDSLSYIDFRENVSVSRIDRLTHLSAYSIMSATVLGGFILGKTVEYALKMARINVENATLDSTLGLEELENIATSTSESNLEMIAATLMTPEKGILAADESGGSIKKKFEALGIFDTAENRHDYREILLSTPGIEEFLTGVILFDETARDTMPTGQTVPEYLISRGIIPGIKVDEGLEKITDIPEASPDETITKGLSDLPARMREYYQMGLRFSKWRAAFEIRLGRDGELKTPTTAAISENCRILAEYAAISQSAGLVPIVEPEVVYDGNYDIDICTRVTAKVLDELFKALARRGVNLKACILKCNMVMNGKQLMNDSEPSDVANATVRVLRSNVPLDLAGVVFLSGGQTPEQATENLAAIMKQQPLAWPMTFSFSRALQGPALEAWAGDNANREAAQNALIDRLTENVNALRII
jgi:fructose-bisphosphate aldolase class I